LFKGDSPFQDASSIHISIVYYIGKIPYRKLNWKINNNQTSKTQIITPPIIENAKYFNLLGVTIQLNGKAPFLLPCTLDFILNFQ